MQTVLLRNKFEIGASKNDIENIIIDVAAGKCKLAEFTNWLRGIWFLLLEEFKIFATGLVLAPVLGIATGVTGDPLFGRLAVFALIVAGLALVVGIIVRIWEWPLRCQLYYYRN